METIVVVDDTLGKFVWKLPPNLSAYLSIVGNPKKNPLVSSMSQREIDTSLKGYLDLIENLIKENLVLIVVGTEIFSGQHLNTPEEILKLFHSMQEDNQRRIHELMSKLD